MLAATLAIRCGCRWRAPWPQPLRPGLGSGPLPTNQQGGEAGPTSTPSRAYLTWPFRTTLAHFGAGAWRCTRRGRTPGVPSLLVSSPQPPGRIRERRSIRERRMKRRTASSWRGLVGRLSSSPWAGPRGLSSSKGLGPRTARGTGRLPRSRRAWAGPSALDKRGRDQDRSGDRPRRSSRWAVQRSVVGA